MYRVTLFLALVTYCSSMSLIGSNQRVSTNIITKDNSDVVDNTGAGYSYFRKQDIDVRPSLKSTVSAPNQDMSEYAHSSALSAQPARSQMINGNSDQMLNRAFGQQQLMPRGNIPVQTLVSKAVPIQQSTFRQNDRMPLNTNFNGVQSGFINQRVFSNQAQDLQPIGSQQILLPRTNLNVPQSTLMSQRNQQQILTVPQQSTWSSQQPSSFGSSFSQQVQRPSVSSGFVREPVQQSFVSGGLPARQIPVRRVIAQSQSSPAVTNGGW